MGFCFQSWHYSKIAITKLTFIASPRGIHLCIGFEGLPPDYQDGKKVCILAREVASERGLGRRRKFMSGLGLARLAHERFGTFRE